MQPHEFRQIALSLPEASESSHMSHPDFRVGGRIFATLGYPDDEFAMVVLPLEEQARLMSDHPKIFGPAKGAWGRSGSTLVRLESVSKTLAREAMVAAWRKRAPQRLQNTSDL